jgi:phosphate transport system ATP-binding protein
MGNGPSQIWLSELFLHRAYAGSSQSAAKIAHADQDSGQRTMISNATMMASKDPLTAYRWQIADRPPPRRQRTKIQFENVNFWYGKSHVLHDVSLAIPEQSVTALIGPSGCGKTTLLRLLNRMNDLIDDARHTGTILLDAQRIDSPALDVVDLRRRVGMVFQKSNAFPRTIYENVAFGPRLAGIRERDRLDYLVERCLKQSALWNEVKDRLGESALQLSGGQQQRLCIARSLATDPEVLLMDEPASALDPKSTQAIEDLITNLTRDYTIVIVTHNMQQAARVADATAFFYEGRLIEYGSTEQIFRKPREKATEDYISGRFG